MPVPSPAPPAGSRALMALGEHLDGIAQLIRMQAAAEDGELEQLGTALSRCGAALDEERWRAARGGAPPSGAYTALACDGVALEPEPERHTSVSVFSFSGQPPDSGTDGQPCDSRQAPPDSGTDGQPCDSRQAPPDSGTDEPTPPTEVIAVGQALPDLGTDGTEKRGDASKLAGEVERHTSKGSQSPATNSVERYTSKGSQSPATNSASSAAPMRRDSRKDTLGVDFFAMDDNRRKRRPSSNKIMRSIEDAMASPWTESIAACLIMLNVMFMVLEGQYMGARIGYDLGIYSHYGSDAFQEETGAPTERFFYVADVVFAVLFTIELALRLVFLRSEFLCDPWGWLDIAVVAVTDAILIASSAATSVSVARVVRLARLLRIVRLARQISLFDSLYLMTTALKGSLSVLFWVVVFLFVVQTLFALLLTNIAQDYYLGPDGEGFFETESEKEEVYRYFGTYWRAMVSLFELMLANWPPICRLMMDTMHEAWSVFALLYKLVMGFAVIGVIFGVFTQETFRAAETDDQLLLKRKVTQERLHTTKMKNLFQAMARKQNEDVGMGIDVRQFQKVLKHPDFQRWLKAMDYDTSDAELLFYLIDTDDDGNLTVDELIQGMAMLKGTARNIDVKLLLRQSIIGRMQRETPKDDSGKKLSVADTLKKMESASRSFAVA